MPADKLAKAATVGVPSLAAPRQSAIANGAATENSPPSLTKPAAPVLAVEEADDVLVVDELSVDYRVNGDWLRVVDQISFSLPAGGTLGLVGESGCGKSTTALAVMDLLIPRQSRVGGGTVRINGKSLFEQSSSVRRKMRGSEMAMIFQEPMSSLNPAFTIGEQIAESIRIHLGLSRRAAWKRAIESLEMVEIDRPEQRAKGYPYEFSGGMLQRAMIASALSCRPSLLVADEPTTALDVTIQAQVLALLKRLQAEFGMGILFITHDLGVVADVCDDIIVMYAGQAVEQGSVEAFLGQQRHPYSQGLVASMPQLAVGRERLQVIPGRVPAPGRMPSGCRFNPRCEHRVEDCVSQVPALVPVSTVHADRCLRSNDLVGRVTE